MVDIQLSMRSIQILLLRENFGPKYECRYLDTFETLLQPNSIYLYRQLLKINLLVPHEPSSV